MTRMTWQAVLAVSSHPGGVLERLQASGEGANDAEKADLFAGTAVRFYRLDPIRRSVA
jgi:hypothetical protein